METSSAGDVGRPWTIGQWDKLADSLYPVDLCAQVEKPNDSEAGCPPLDDVSAMSLQEVSHSLRFNW